MAQAVADGARERQGVRAVLKRVGEAGVDELADVERIILGPPARDAKVPPAVSQFLERLKDMPLQAKIAAAFGSYG